MKQSSNDSDNPVFYDKSGKRWITAQAIALLVGGFLMLILPITIPELLATRRVVAFQQQVPDQASHITPSSAAPPSPTSLANELSNTNIPVIGKGALVRIIKIKLDGAKQLATDPFSGKVVGQLSPNDANYIDGDAYAIQRYGETNGRKIALTFDDGPHPLYTPQILDLLSRNATHATFFVTGNNVVKYPDVAKRLVNEGHSIANHTFSHINFNFTDSHIAEQEINQTSRLIASVTQQHTSFFRPPYGGDSDQSLRNSLLSLLTAQKMGYINTSYTFDSSDWQFPNGLQPRYPSFDGNDQVVLVHDSGGDRSRTIPYVQQLITRAKQQGYTFVSLNTLYPQTPSLIGHEEPTTGDRIAFFIAWSALVFPKEMMTNLFIFSLISIAFVTILNLSFAIIQRTRNHYISPTESYRPFVSIIVPAYNESAVINKTVRSLIESDYKHNEIIIVDDGSTDNTWKVISDLAQSSTNIIPIHQQNGGKSSALNHAISRSKGSIIIGVDADTVFLPQTISNLIRHFKDENVGAVAGVVRVGNIKDILTLWQALEYALSISIERNAHALLSSIMIVPGACGAWRKSAVIEAGGFSHSTLAEDCDLTLKIQELGHYKILQDNRAISYTEAPQKMKSLIKQRFRWTFGNIQALWKHRHMILNEKYSYLGMFVMPYSVISIMTSLLFWPFLTFVAVQNIISGNYMIILIYFGITLALQFIVATIGLLLTRAPLYYLAAVPFARFIYGPIRIYVLYKTLVIALRGSYVGWNKLVRMGTVKYTPNPQPYTPSASSAKTPN
jgi:cellulose synthase/poly-beta-1,6-N-acetylglucosamine synthase-like glycosyltransferase/peptidoglycan/xylan/chitin deacetylase (PgdA/CDA1 family)